jgi:hypothetical protein
MSGSSIHNLRKDGDPFVQKTGSINIVEEDLILSKEDIASGATIAVDGKTRTGILKGRGKIDGAAAMRAVVSMNGANYTAGDTLTLKLYRIIDGATDTQIGADLSIVLPSCNSGYSQFVEVDDPNGYLTSAEYYQLSGTITGTASGIMTLQLEKVGGTTSGGSAGGVTSGDTFTEGTTGVSPAGFVVNSTGDEPLTDGKTSAPAMDEYRGPWAAPDDRIAKTRKVRETFPDNWVKKPYESLVSETNITAAGTYRVEIDMDGYDNATIDVICSGGVSVDIFGTDNPDADDTADTGWVSLSATTITDTTDGWVLTGQEAWRKLMIKYVTSDTSNAIDVDVNLGG